MKFVITTSDHCSTDNPLHISHNHKPYHYQIGFTISPGLPHDSFVFNKEWGRISEINLGSPRFKFMTE
jgi:hypothetical protein